jgi:predicted RND superfamily exporter protein
MDSCRINNLNNLKMNREELKKQIVINFEKDDITEKERLINVMQCIDAHIKQLSIPLVSNSLPPAKEVYDNCDTMHFEDFKEWYEEYEQ